MREAIASAQDGDTILITSQLQLTSTVEVNKRLTIRIEPLDAWRIIVYGGFEGPIFDVLVPGVTFDWIRLGGSERTDGLRIHNGDVQLNDCILYYLRFPIHDVGNTPSKVRLERCSIDSNQNGLSCRDIQARDSTFTRNRVLGLGATFANLDRCRFENNYGDGLSIQNGTVKNCIFRYNSDIGFRFDPDPGVLSLSGSLFYANGGGGLLLREEAIATVDNCTFTRHTGPPAVTVTEAHYARFRHCTIVDNVYIPQDYSPFVTGGAFAIDSRVELQNCIIAQNPTNGQPDTAGLVGEWIDLGGNIIGGAPHLGALADNGGPTFTLMPQSNSPAIDAGVFSDLVTDARGLSRQAGEAPDAGAVEANAGPVPDTDADGLPDFWESNQDLDPADASDAQSDRDQDGQTALGEFTARTDPRDPESVLRIEEIILLPPPQTQPEQRVIYLIWQMTPGLEYNVETSPDLVAWRTLPGYIHTYAYDGRPRHLFQTEADSPTGFYRIKMK